jgi:predicted nucleic acid-binding protein
MSVYLDTALILKSYIYETTSPDAIAIVEMAGDPIIFSHLHALEIPNAIRLKRFRGEITKAEETTAIRIFQADVDAGRLARPDYDLVEIFIRAERLSAKYSGDFGARSLDVLHVAAALECSCQGFASFDQRQRKIASLAGLKVTPAKIP